LESYLPEASGRSLALVWHNRSVVATFRRDYRSAQTALLNALTALKRVPGFERGYMRRLETLSYSDLRLAAKIWSAIAATLMDRGFSGRMKLAADALIARFEPRELHAEPTTIYITKGVAAERERNFEEARRWYHQAHARVLAARNWYFHLYVLYAYARLERHLRNFAQAYWYL